MFDFSCSQQNSLLCFATEYFLNFKSKLQKETRGFDDSMSLENANADVAKAEKTKLPNEQFDEKYPRLLNFKYLRK